MNYDSEHALELLRLGSGRSDAAFREGQEEAIRHIVNGQGRLLVVQKTGWGKSFVYFIATKLLREQDMGPTLLISPLLALMRNQVAAAKKMGVEAETINSDNADDWSEIETRLDNGTVDVLLISPERLANEGFRQRVLEHVVGQVAFLVIDEAHCISDWGHDFRPNYRRLERIVNVLPPNLRLLATTATANDRVMADLIETLGPGLSVSRGDLARKSLTLQSILLPDQAKRLAWLAEQVETLDGHGIIYTLTKRDARQVADWLQENGLAVEAYSRASGDAREELEDALMNNQLKALVATQALGMGYDKPDLAFVIHYQTPGSVVAYYQQVGRAGRALESAYGVLLSGREEDDINTWFINSAFPTKNEVDTIIRELETEPDGLSVPSMLARLNISQGRIEKTLELLSLESPAPLVKQDTRWQLTAAELSPEFWRRADRLTDLRRDEREQMQTYARLPFGRHMPFLIDALDGDSESVEPPSLPPLSSEADPVLTKLALAFLRRTSLPIEPRKRWPAGGLPCYELRGNIGREERAQEGRALCVWGDAGWSELVQHGKYRDDHFPDELVTACAEMVEAWGPQPDLSWVTCVPSLRRPELVPNLARRLAERLQLPFYPIITRTDDRPEQKSMNNSAQQAKNVDGSLQLQDVTLPSGPVLLVDDMVDSGWTLTVAAWLLLNNGSDEVWPVALSKTGSSQ